MTATDSYMRSEYLQLVKLNVTLRYVDLVYLCVLPVLHGPEVEDIGVNTV